MTTCAVDGCDRPKRRGRFCHGHRTRRYRYGDVYADVPLGQLRALRPHRVGQWPARRFEDAAWLAETGASVLEAADRLGIQPGSVWRLFTRHGRPDLWQRMKAAA